MSDPFLGDFDPWTASLPDLADKARWLSPMIHGQQAEDTKMWLLDVLQARAALEAAESQRKTNRWLVWATWALVLATIGLLIFR